MVLYFFINFGGGFGISVYYYVYKLVCLVGMIYLGYGIIIDFSILLVVMWWWFLLKIIWFCVGYIVLWGFMFIMGFFICFIIEDYL